MSKFTSTLALALVAMGMNAQVTVPSLTNGKLLTAEQLKNEKQPMKIVINLAHTQASNLWYAGNTDKGDMKAGSFTHEVVLLWESDGKGGHTLKKAFPGVKESGYVANTTPHNLTPTTDNAQSFIPVTPLLNGGSGNTLVTGDNLPTEKDAAYRGNLLRFTVTTDQSKWLNCNGGGSYNNGTGSWTIFYAYDATDYNLVTIKETKNGTTTSKQVMYKTGDNIEIPQYSGYTSSITKATKNEKADQVVDITYTVTNWQDRAKATVAKAQELVDASKAQKVGYPTNYADLQTAIDALGTATDSVTFYTAFNKALSAYKSDLTVSLPVEGKAYKIEAVYPNGKSQALYFNDNTGVNRIFNGNNSKLNDDVFVCHTVGNKFMFVNNRGQYLLWFDSGDANKSESKDGYTTTYNAQFNDWTLSRADMTNSYGGIIQEGTTNEQLFGLLMMQGKGKDNKSYYLNTNSNGDFVSGNENGKWYDQTGSNFRTFAFRFTEVPYANEVDLKAIEGKMINIANASSIATFSAPFATTIPADVTAYYVAQNGVQGNVATLTQVTGTIPANTGVILTGATAQKVTMIPATETVTEFAGNKLGHSAGAAKDMTTSGNYFVLGLSGNEVGFFKGATTTGATLGMNKAYLTADAAAQAIQLQFGGETTGIEAVEGVQQTNAAIFDLSGRRVFQTVKGGLYIQNGKKFIAQ